MESNFKIGEWYEATPQNTEGLTPGKAYECIQLSKNSILLAWVATEDGRRCVYMNEQGGPNNDVERIETPKELDPVRAFAAIKHQKTVTQDVLKLISEHPRFTRGDITVVGGAPRDWDYNIPAQDIDIWLKNETFGDDQFRLLKRIFEPQGGTVRKVTNNDYARDGEYIHYIYNVVWQDVDLQFIFVEDPSVEAVIQHVCCNFSEISWAWREDLLKPTLPYKTGRMARVLEFKDDKGRSPRDNYVAKMAARYPDHKLVLPASLKHLEGTYGDRCVTESTSKGMQAATKDGTWGPEVSYDVAEKFNTDVLKCVKGDLVRALVDFDGECPLKKGQIYTVDRVYPKEDQVILKGWPAWYRSERFEVVQGKPEVITGPNDARPEGYSKYLIQISRGINKGNYWKAIGCGPTPNRKEAYVFTSEVDDCQNNRIWIE